MSLNYAGMPFFISATLTAYAHALVLTLQQKEGRSNEPGQMGKCFYT